MTRTSTRFVPSHEAWASLKTFERRRRSGNGNDILNGDDGDDHLNGDGGNDQLFGGAHQDQLNGGSGTDQCFGGTGTNTFLMCEVQQ